MNAAERARREAIAVADILLCLAGIAMELGTEEGDRLARELEDQGRKLARAYAPARGWRH